MAFTKVWLGATADYSLSTNWELISLRSAAFAWTVSSVPTEYYLRTAGGANPGFVATPPTASGVYLNSAAATKGTLGSLTAGQWSYGDNDTLGYSTVYVRTSGSVDPDTLAADYVQFRQIPQTGENVRIPAGSGAITTVAGLDQSAVAIGEFIREDGHTGAIGAKTAYLRIAPTKLEDHGRQQAFFDIGSANINVVADSLATASPGEYGMHLRGTNIALLDVRRGLVGLAVRGGELSTVTDIVVGEGESAKLACGKGVTLTDVVTFGGELWLSCSAVTLLMYDGKSYLSEAAAISTSVTQWAGEFHYGSSGNIATYNLRGGTLNERASNIARTIATLNKYRGGFEILRNKEAVTHTAEVPQESYDERSSA